MCIYIEATHTAYKFSALPKVTRHSVAEQGLEPRSQGPHSPATVTRIPGCPAGPWGAAPLPAGRGDQNQQPSPWDLTATEAAHTGRLVLPMTLPTGVPGGRG